MDEQNVVYPYNEYLAIKRNEGLMHTTWINLKSIVLSESSQLQKTHILYKNSFIRKSRIEESIKIEYRLISGCLGVGVR